MVSKRDITDLVDFENNDDESLPLRKCVCGETFAAWDFLLSVYPEWPRKCPRCGRKMFFELSIRVFEIVEQPNKEGQSG